MKTKEKPRNFYYVCNWSGYWYIIRANNKAEARSHGVKEFSRGSVKSVDVASEGEILSYMSLKGLHNREDIDEV